jgi:hypothetical protein
VSNGNYAFGGNEVRRKFGPVQKLQGQAGFAGYLLIGVSRRELDFGRERSGVIPKFPNRIESVYSKVLTIDTSTGRFHRIQHGLHS